VDVLLWGVGKGWSAAGVSGTDGKIDFFDRCKADMKTVLLLTIKGIWLMAGDTKSASNI
jgi:hypothetical protein